jgi:hypothetical protein
MDDQIIDQTRVSGNVTIVDFLMTRDRDMCTNRHTKFAFITYLGYKGHAVYAKEKIDFLAELQQ